MKSLDSMNRRSGRDLETRGPRPAHARRRSRHWVMRGRHAVALIAAATLSILGFAACTTSTTSYPSPIASDLTPGPNADLPPNAQTLHSLARLMLSHGRVRQAESLLVQINREDPEYIPAYLELSHIRLRQRRFDEAADALKQAVSRRPNDPVLLNNLGFCLLLGKDYAGALPYFQSAQSLHPAAPRYRANAALALGMLGRYAESMAAFREMLPPEVVEYNIGVIAEARKDFDIARVSFSRAEALGFEMSQAGAGSIEALVTQDPVPVEPAGYPPVSDGALFEDADPATQTLVLDDGAVLLEAALLFPPVSDSEFFEDADPAAQTLVLDDGAVLLESALLFPESRSGARTADPVREDVTVIEDSASANSWAPVPRGWEPADRPDPKMDPLIAPPNPAVVRPPDPMPAAKPERILPPAVQTPEAEPERTTIEPATEPAPIDEHEDREEEPRLPPLSEEHKSEILADLTQAGAINRIDLFLRTVKLSDYGGKVAMLVFVWTGCTALLRVRR